MVVNLYPFADAVRTKTREEDIIEMIDIGGPSMLRSAAKNHRFVAAVCDPADYGPVARELQENKGQLGQASLKRLAAKVFRATSAYDAMIAEWMGGHPQTFKIELKKSQDLRYGENPHQKAALYAEEPPAGVPGAKQLQGKELSFNNILDLDAAWEMARAFPGPACAVVKHTCPCGFATAGDIRAAFRLAWDCDPLSAFGSIIGVNRPVDGKLAKDMLAAGFIECVVAPAFDKPALEAFAAKKNLRLMAVGDVGAPLVGARAGTRPAPTDYKKITGGWRPTPRSNRHR